MAAGGKEKADMAFKQEWWLPQALQKPRRQKGRCPEVHAQRMRPHVFGSAEVRPNVTRQDMIMTQPGMHCRGMSTGITRIPSAMPAPPPRVLPSSFAPLRRRSARAPYCRRLRDRCLQCPRPNRQDGGRGSSPRSPGLSARSVEGPQARRTAGVKASQEHIFNYRGPPALGGSWTAAATWQTGRECLHIQPGEILPFQGAA